MSAAVTLAMSSILSTSACGVGTQITSLPAWPTCGSNGLSCATATLKRRATTATHDAAAGRENDCNKPIRFLR